jgi:hypothetical protein
MTKEVHIKTMKNTSLQSDIQRSPALAAQLLRKYGPERFSKIAGPNYKPASTPEVKP